MIISPKFPTASILLLQMMMEFSSLKIKISSVALMITKLLTTGTQKDTIVTGTTWIINLTYSIGLALALTHTSWQHQPPPEISTSTLRHTSMEWRIQSAILSMECHLRCLLRSIKMVTQSLKSPSNSFSAAPQLSCKPTMQLRMCLRLSLTLIGLSDFKLKISQCLFILLRI